MRQIGAVFNVRATYKDGSDHQVYQGFNKANAKKAYEKVLDRLANKRSPVESIWFTEGTFYRDV